jgi:hypothetical protein
MPAPQFLISALIGVGVYYGGRLLSRKIRRYLDNHRPSDPRQAKADRNKTAKTLKLDPETGVYIPSND